MNLLKHARILIQMDIGKSVPLTVLDEKDSARKNGAVSQAGNVRTASR